MWFFDGIRNYFGGDAIHEHVLGSAEYDRYVELCTADARVRPLDELILRNRQYETRVRTEAFRHGEYSIKKCHTLSTSLRDGSIARDDRTVQVIGPPTRLDQIVRGGWLTFWSVVSFNGIALAAAMLVGTDLGVVYRSMPDGLPSRQEMRVYTDCRTQPLVETVSVCRDGWVSRSVGPGTCSWHGGVSHRDEVSKDRSVRECVRDLLEQR